MATSITITLNGTQRGLPEAIDASTVAALVEALGFRADRVALERNGEILPRSAWHETLVEHGDRIELVHFVGGGGF